MNALDVAGIGSMVLDRLHRVPRIVGAEDKGPLRPLPDGGLSRDAVGGVVLNHLGWAAALGLRTGIFGKQADDAAGRFLRAGMDRLGIERDLVLDGSASSRADIFVDDDGARAIYFASGATGETTAAHVRAHHGDMIARAARVTSEVHQLPLAAVLETLRIADAAGVPTLVDVDMPPSVAVPDLGSRDELEAVLAGARILKPSKAAARELAPDAGDDALAGAQALRARFGSDAVVVTDGEHGCAISAPDFEGRVPATPIAAVDTTGAGDAFLGGLLVGLRHGLAWPAAAALANAAGAACAEQLGAFPDDPAAARARVLARYDGPALDLGPLPAGAAAGARADTACFDVALAELTALRARIGGAGTDAAIALVRGAVEKGGRVHVTGVGKCEHVARFGAAHFSSVGTPAVFLHATEATHGSAGQIAPGDVLIAISNSGETPELAACVDVARRFGARVIAVTGRGDSTLARAADAVLDAGVSREGGPLGLAPRASVAAQVLVLTAFSAALQEAAGFTREDYQARHPSGELGRRSR